MTNKYLTVGARVFWRDPDNSLCSGFGKITEITDGDGELTPDETVYTVERDGGGLIEALAHELIISGDYITIPPRAMRKTITIRGLDADFEPDDLLRSSRSLQMESDTEITIATRKIYGTDRILKQRVKRGPGRIRHVRIPGIKWLHDAMRGKHRGILTSDVRNPYYVHDGMFGEFLKQMREGSDKFAADALTITPEVQQELRQRFNELLTVRPRGWVRKQVVGEQAHPFKGVPVRNPLPIPVGAGMSARYTGEVQLGSLVEVTDAGGAGVYKGTVIAIEIKNGGDTIVSVRTGWKATIDVPIANVVLIEKHPTIKIEKYQENR